MASHANPLVRIPMASSASTTTTRYWSNRRPALAAAVVKLGDSLRKYLGPMPYAAWNEAMDEGRVVTAVSGGRDLRGYVLGCDSPGRRSRLRTWPSLPSAAHRGRAHAHPGHKQPVRRSNRHPSALPKGLPGEPGLACARVHRAGNLPGRGGKGQLLTLWWLDHGHQDLLTWADRPQARSQS